MFILVVLAMQTISASRDSAPMLGFRQASPQGTARAPARNLDKAEVAPQCETTGTNAITISCTYTSSPRPAFDPKNVPRIVLNHAKVSFEPNHESHMLVELEFTNDGASTITPATTVYLVIDDDTGRNVVRRLLPHVDLAKLHDGEGVKFSERFLVGAFPGGRYTISLSIPDPEASRKNIPAYNTLLSSVGVPDPTTGLNIVAHFSIARSMHSSHDK